MREWPLHRHTSDEDARLETAVWAAYKARPAISETDGQDVALRGRAHINPMSQIESFSGDSANLPISGRRL